MNLLRAREKFLVLEVGPKGAHGTFLSVDEDRHIIFEKWVKNIDIEKFFKAPVRKVTEKTWEGKHFFKSRRKVIVAADPAFATTIPIPLDLVRDQMNVKSKILAVELENMIAQAMQKIFNGCRSEAAKRLTIDEIHTILVGAKAKHFTVDGKAVMNPVGFGGKKISLLLELTFTSRQLFQDLKQFFNSPEDFFFAEAPQARLFSLSRIRKLPLNLIVADEDGTSLYVLQEAKGGHAVLYREKLGWRFTAFFKKIADMLAVGAKTAEDFYRAYRHGEMSSDAARAMKKELAPVLEELFSEIKGVKIRGTVYVDMPYPAPLDLPHAEGGIKFEEHPLPDILSKLGFSADLDALGEKKNAAVRALLYFLEAYFDKSDSEINQKLRRRLHWLVA